MKDIDLSNIKWGEIYLCNFEKTVGSVQSGIRPALVIQNDVGNTNSPTIVVAMITTVLKKLNQPTHVVLDTSCGLRETSMVMLEQVCTIDKSKEVLKYVGRVEDKSSICKICKAMMVEFALNRHYRARRCALMRCLCDECRTKVMHIPEIILRRVDPFQAKKKLCDRCCTQYGYDYFAMKKECV